ncbi:extracellular solute-binding protein [Faecalibacterium sp. An122]|uniref:extracellular solute-binding protein n=1 Tax=Faecalibacterium sp. An122 TaxID=1965551 RepID=UPI0013021E34|nr:extracellular solute-binding protein [Faecalibacterium sp. An122]
MPTINDIAKEAGVSHGTVSNVLNKTGKVSIEKIRLVEEAIKKLGYVPNVQAQRLRQGAPSTIAVLLPSLKETKYIDFFTAIQLNFPKSQNSLLVYQTEDIPAEEEAILDNLRVSGLVALITVSCLSKECLEKYRSLPCPVIYIDRKPCDLRSNEWFIAFDTSQIGEDIAVYCSSQAWQRMAYFGASRHGESEDLLLKNLKASFSSHNLSLHPVSANYKLALNQAFDFAHICAQYDAILLQSSICMDALFSAFQLLHIEKIPAIVIIGAYSAPAREQWKSYQLDYGFLGIRTVKMLSKLSELSENSSQEALFRPKGFADHLSSLKRMPGGELTMLTLENPSTQALKNLLPEFEYYSGIKVRLISVPYDDLLAQLNLIGPQFTYDMIRIDVAQFDDVGKKIYLPFDEIPISSDELPPRLIQSGYNNYSLLENRIYALPLDPSVQIFLYRADLFNDAKLCRAYYEHFHENLAVPTTYDQYLHVAEFFSQEHNPDSPTEYGTTLTCGSAAVAASDFLPFYLSKTDSLCDADGRIRLDTPAMEEAVRQYQTLEKFACKQNWWGDSIRQFSEGRTAMTIVYSNYAAALINSKNSTVVGKVGAAVIPGRKPLLGGGVVGISRYSTKVDACKQFFNWYYSTEIASLLVRLGGTSPIIDAYEDFQNYSIFPWMNTSKKSFGLGQRGIKDGSHENFSIQKYEFAIGTTIRNVLQGMMSVEGAGKMAQALYDASDSLQ